jgi:leader peptidase (prepilin peptidase)/N-methyltransferase
MPVEILLVAVGAILTSPILASLILRTPDRADPGWWRPARTPVRLWLAPALVGAAFSLLAARTIGWSADLPAFWVLALLCAVLSLIDVAHHRLPNRLISVGAVSALLLLAAASVAARDWMPFGRAVAAASAAGGGLAALSVLSRGGLGFGDVKLGALLGAHLGWLSWALVLPGLLAGFVIGAFAAMAMIITRRAALRDPVAFGPALCTGALLTCALLG